MLAHLQALFAPPLLADDEKTRVSILLYTIELLLLAAGLVGIAVGLLFGRISLASTMVLAMVITMMAMVLTRRGFINLAAMLITNVMMISMTYIAYKAEGIYAHAVLTFTFVIVISSLILRRDLFIINAASTIVAAGFLTWAQMEGYIETPPGITVSLYDFVSVSVILFITALVTRLTANHLQDNVTRARENESALVMANQALLQQKRVIQQREAETSMFLQKLQSLYEVSLELARVKSLPDLYYQAVELGRTKLDFDRLGVLLYDPSTREMIGTCGTDEHGRTVDESHFRESAFPYMLDMLEARSRIFVRESAPLFSSGQPVGYGWNALSLLWDGRKGIGWLSTDNLTTGQDLQPFQVEILTLYAATLGHLITRLHAEDALQASEMEARYFQQKLQALHEVGIVLAAAETLDILCRQAIELGRAQLGFDRLGLLLYDAETGLMQGTFGTDEQGHLRDERYFKQKVENTEIMDILKSQKRIGFWEDTVLWDVGNPIGKGWNAAAVLWNGKEGIGWLATDNLIKREPVTPFQLELLTLYGTLLGHLVTLKRREETLNKYARELERSNGELAQFAYTASHDLQEPLRKVQTFGDRLTANYVDVLDARGLDYLARMQDAAARMQQLIQDLLVLSRVSTRAQPFTAVDLTAVLHEVLVDLETRIEEKQAVITISDLPTIQADRTQMRQLFQNLLGNALKFNHPDSPPHIVIGVQQAPDNSEQSLTIFVQDNGIGLDEKYADRIFSPFQRLHDRNEYEGSGIGLAICKRIVDRHNGRMTVHSQPGEGATFLVSLPWHQSK